MTDELHLDVVEQVLHTALAEDFSFHIEKGKDLRELFLDDEDNRESITDAQGGLIDGWDGIEDSAVYVMDSRSRLHGPCMSLEDIVKTVMDSAFAEWRGGNA